MLRNKQYQVNFYRNHELTQAVFVEAMISEIAMMKAKKEVKGVWDKALIMHITGIEKAAPARTADENNCQGNCSTKSEGAQAI